MPPGRRGSFTTDDGERFNFMIDCKAVGSSVVWFSCVRHKGDYRGSPSGIFVDLTLDRAGLGVS